MASISIISPIDQPTGRNRLIDELKAALGDQNLNSFQFIVAFAKVGPLLRLKDKIESWRQQGNTIECIVGIDQNGTSEEAIEFGLNYFDSINTVHIEGTYSPTFHSKIYLFKGSNKALAFIGSNNLTVGGLETNFETYVKIEMALPSDQTTLDELDTCWKDCINVAKVIDQSYLSLLKDQNLVITENQMRTQPSTTGIAGSRSTTVASSGLGLPQINLVPASAVPRTAMTSTVVNGSTAFGTASTQPSSLQIPVRGLAIQVTPHHNGEILLSMLAVNQNPGFFGFPFTGQTVPKKTTNPSYPQRIPDPVVELSLYDNQGNRTIHHPQFNLNSVYYTPKSEFRITVPQDIVQATAPHVNGPYPIMLITSGVGHDYDMEVYLPDSQQYNQFLAICNQTMPAGGKPIARRFGWF